jgi:hypothetical protein
MNTQTKIEPAPAAATGATRDLEFYAPSLSPIVLAVTAAAAAGTDRAALLDHFDPVSAEEVGKALVDLDISAFSEAAREQLAMAGRRLGKAAAAGLPADETVTGGRLAVLTQAWRWLSEGALVWIQTTDRASVAYVAVGSRVSPETGAVLLPRTRVAMAPPARRVRPMALPSEVDTAFKFANMAKPLLPGPVGEAIGMAQTLANLFSGDSGPSEAEIIIDAVKRAVDAAVVELKAFITGQKLDDLTADINAAYGWLSLAADQVRAATTTAQQVSYARRALGPDQLPANIAQLNRTLNRLLLMAPRYGDESTEPPLNVKAKALKLVAHGAAALFTLEKLQLQFDAFLALAGGADPQGIDRRAQAHEDLVQLKHDVLGPAGYGQAFHTMYEMVLGARGSMQFGDCHDPMMLYAMGVYARDAYQVFDLYDGTKEWFTLETANAVLVAAGYPPSADLEGTKHPLVAIRIAAFRDEHGLQVCFDQMAAYERLMPDWDKAMLEWGQSSG